MIEAATAWAALKDQWDERALERFAKEQPQGPERTEARRRLNVLRRGKELRGEIHLSNKSAREFLEQNPDYPAADALRSLMEKRATTRWFILGGLALGVVVATLVTQLNPSLQSSRLGTRIGEIIIMLSLPLGWIAGRIVHALRASKCKERSTRPR